MQGRNWVKGFPDGDLKKFKSERFLCDHHYMPYDGHALEFTKGVDIESDDDLDLFWVTFWYSNPARETTNTFWWRLKAIWKYLRHGYILHDEFTFDPKTVYRMGAYLAEEAEMSAVDYILGDDKLRDYSSTLSKYAMSPEEMNFFFGMHRGEMMEETVKFVEYAGKYGGRAVLDLNDVNGEFILEIDVYHILGENTDKINAYASMRTDKEKHYLPVSVIT